MRRAFRNQVGLCLLAGIILSGCRVRSISPSKTKHIFGRTSVQPSEKLSPCVDGASYPAAVSYIRELADRIMSRNPETFREDYAPEKFCFEVVDIPGVNASASPATGLVTIRAELLRLTTTGDAPVAAVLAHELAHVTMQHRRRDPVSEDLPKDIDLVELERRMEAQRAWRAKISASRAALIDDAIKSQFIETAAKVTRDKGIWQRIKPTLGTIDHESFDYATEGLVKVAEQYDSALSDPQKDQLKTWRMLDMLSSNLEELFNSASEFPNLSKPESTNCSPSKVCEDRKNLRFLLNYSSSSIKPSMDLTCGNRLDPKNDPQFYAPWVQWIEQQADEVGFELYVRAGFLPASFTTFVETMMKADNQFKTCLDSLKSAGFKAPRVTDEFVDGHPPYCFRYENITVHEMASHVKDYAPLMGKATVVSIPELNEKREVARKSVLTSP